MVLPFLRSRGISRIDKLLVSHGDNDHAGGVASLIGGIETLEVLTNAPTVAKHSSPCRQGTGWEWDGVRFEILWPENTLQGGDNNSSCVLLITTEGDAFCFPGISRVPRSADCLDVSRHRAYGPIFWLPLTTAAGLHPVGEFLEAVGLRFAVFSIGYRNRFGFPHAEVVERYQRRRVTLYDSVGDGAVTFELIPGAAAGAPLGYRRLSRRFWHY